MLFSLFPVGCISPPPPPPGGLMGCFTGLLQLEPWANLWLLAGITVSVLLHAYFLEVPAFASMFGAQALG